MLHLHIKMKVPHIELGATVFHLHNRTFLNSGCCPPWFLTSSSVTTRRYNSMKLVGLPSGGHLPNYNTILNQQSSQIQHTTLLKNKKINKKSKMRFQTMPQKSVKLFYRDIKKNSTALLCFEAFPMLSLKAATFWWLWISSSESRAILSENCSFTLSERPNKASGCCAFTCTKVRHIRSFLFRLIKMSLRFTNTDLIKAQTSKNRDR